MRLPPEIQFYEDAHLLVYRPHGLLNEASVNKVTSLIEDLEEKLKEPSIASSTRWSTMTLSSISDTS